MICGVFGRAVLALWLHAWCADVRVCAAAQSLRGTKFSVRRKLRCCCCGLRGRRCCVGRRGAARQHRCHSSFWRPATAVLTSQSAPVPSVSPSPAVWLPSALLSAWRLSWGASWARQSDTRCVCDGDTDTVLAGRCLQVSCRAGCGWRFRPWPQAMFIRCAGVRSPTTVLP